MSLGAMKRVLKQVFLTKLRSIYVSELDHRNHFTEKLQHWPPQSAVTCVEYTLYTLCLIHN